MKDFENKIICGDNMAVMAGLPDNVIDTIICDPQYGLGFMGKDWDKVLPNPITWTQALRIAKPGAMMLVFGGTRTYHRLTCAIEDAGWQIRDCMIWLYGSGFPKSHDISKAIDKAKGAEREVVGKKISPYTPTGRNESPDYGEYNQPTDEKGYLQYDLTAPATDLAKQWDGYGTALKPAWEPIIVAMKPLDGTFAQNVEKWGVGGLWIDGARIGTTKNVPASVSKKKQANCYGKYAESGETPGVGGHNPNQGRFPANLILDDQAAAMLDEQSGTLISGGGNKSRKGKSRDGTRQANCFGTYDSPPDDIREINSGGASRFFYCAKASRSERNEGLEGMEATLFSEEEKGMEENRTDTEYRPGDDGKQGIQSRLHGATTKGQNNHPTVKPLKLMEYLCKLTKMPGDDDIVLDPFGGSGTTAVACINTGRKYLVIEKDPHYCEIARARVKEKGLFGIINNQFTP